MSAPDSRRRPALVVLTVLALCAASGSYATPVLTVTPASIGENDGAPIDIRVTGLAGSTAYLRLRIDADADGVADPGEDLVFADVLRDNTPEWSPAMAADEDPAVGAIRVHERLFMPFNLPTLTGTFTWEVVDAANASVARKPFVVTAAPGAVQSVEGTVIDTSTGLPIAGAIVVLDSLQFTEPFTVSDASGRFVLRLATTYPCDERTIVGGKAGYFTSLGAVETITFHGATQATGAKLLLTPGAHRITGRALHSSGPLAGTGVPGLLTFGQLASGAPLFALGTVTDETGAYVISVPDGDWGISTDDQDNATQQGIVGGDGARVSVTVNGADVTAPDIMLAASNAFVTGTVRDATGQPVGAGYAIRLGSSNCSSGSSVDCFETFTQTSTAGTFVVGTIASGAQTYTIGVDHRFDVIEGFVAEAPSDFTLANGQTLVGQDIRHVQAAGRVRGTLRRADGTAVPGGSLTAFEQSGPSSSRALFTACDGTFNIPIGSGPWQIEYQGNDSGAWYHGLPTDRTVVQHTLVSAEDSGVDLTLPDPCRVRLAFGEALGVSQGQVLSVPLVLEAGTCVKQGNGTVLFDSSALSLVGTSDVLAGCTLQAVAGSPGEANLSVSCPSGVNGSVTLGNLRFQVTSLGGARASLHAIGQDGFQWTNCASGPVDDQETEEVPGTVTLACVPGDIHPLGTGDGVVALSDWLLGQRVLRGAASANARNANCGDLAPGLVTCRPPVGAPAWCPFGDAAFGAADLAALRGLASDMLRTSCNECPQACSEPAFLVPDVPGDIAPHGARDGGLTISDVVLGLRISVALVTPTAGQLALADVAPFSRAGNVATVVGDGVVTVADVVIMLRSSVQLEVIEFPARRLAIALPAGAAHVAFSARITGWPANVALPDVDAPACASGTGEGVDESADAIAVTCATDPTVTTGPADLVTLTYSSASPIDPASLGLDLQLLNASLAPVSSQGAVIVAR